MEEKEISRADVLARLDVDDAIHEMLMAEPHHDHPIVEVDGQLHWKEVPEIRKRIGRENLCLNDLVPLLEALGYGRNSETLRRMYRGMGYYLFGYWEIFHWEANNKDADEYVPNKIP